MSTVNIEVRLKDRKVNEVGLRPGKSLTIGRRDDNGLVLDLPTISLLHARIDEENDSWLLTDLGSSNGVTVNGDRVKRRKLRVGDEVEIGPYTLCFTARTDAVDKISTNPIKQPAEKSQGAEAEFELEVLCDGSDDVEKTITIDNRITIGRGSGCDLILKGDLTVSEQHLSIEKIPQGWVVKNLNRSFVTWLNKIPIRDQAPIQIGDIINVGNTRLRFKTITQVASTQADKRRLTIPKGNFLAAISGPQGRRPRLVALAGVLIFILLSTFMFGGGEKADNNLDSDSITAQADSTADLEEKTTDATDKTSKEHLPATDLKSQRLRNRYLTWAQDLLSKGEYELAVYRVEAGLQELPNDEQLQQLRLEARLAFANQLAEQKQYQQAVDNLKALQLDDNLQVTELLAELESKYSQEQNEARIYDELDLKFGAQLQQIKQSYQDNRLSDAQAIVDEMLSSEGLDKFPAAKQLTNKWNQKLKTAKANLAKQEKNKLVEKEQLQQNTRDHYASCLKAEQQGELVAALKACQLAAAGDPNLSEQNDALNKVNSLKAQLKAEAGKYYDNGLRCSEQNDLSCAMRNWHYAVYLNPEHVKAREGLEGILPAQVKKAQALYREGLAYEGLNNMPQAITRWNEVLSLLPVEDELYYQKALKKLREHGEQ